MAVNYYKKLGIDPDATIEEIQEILIKKERDWAKREYIQPEKAAKMVVIINDAKKVFANAASKAEYDKNLDGNVEEDEYANDPDAERHANLDKWRDQALSYLFDTQQYDLAKMAIEKAVAFLSPQENNSRFYYAASMVYHFNGEEQQAKDYINKCIVEEPDFTWGYIQKNFIYSNEVTFLAAQNKLPQAKAKLEECRAILETAIKRAEANGDKEGACEAYYRMGETYHNYLAYSGENIGSIVDRGIDIDHEKAMYYGEKAVAANPDSAAANLFLNDVKQTIEKEENKARADKARADRIAAGEQYHKKRTEEWEAEQLAKRQAQDKYRNKEYKRARLVGVLLTLFVIFIIGWNIFMLYIKYSNKGMLGFLSIVGVLIAMFLAYRLQKRAIQTKENIKGAVCTGLIGTILFSWFSLGRATNIGFKGTLIISCIIAVIALVAGIVHALISKAANPEPEKVASDANITNYRNYMKEADTALQNGNSLLALMKLLVPYGEYRNQGMKGFPQLPAHVAEYYELVSEYYLAEENDYENSLKNADYGITAADDAISENAPDTPVYKLIKTHLMYIRASALEYLGRHDEAVSAVREMRQYAEELSKDATDLGFIGAETMAYSYIAISYLATAKVNRSISKKIEEAGFKGVNDPDVLSRMRDRGIDNDVEKAAEYAKRSDELKGTQKTDLYVLVYHMHFGKK